MTDYNCIKATRGSRKRNFKFTKICKNKINLISNIGNLDEIPMNFDTIRNRTVSSKGYKTILQKTTGHERTRFIVVLFCMADGTKLKPIVIFKKKMMPELPFFKKVFPCKF